jgi:thymidine kinase
MGRIELIIGCMYSGKTTEIIRQIKRYKSLNKNIIIITHTSDNRYYNSGNISTHNRENMKAIPLSKLKDIYTEDYKEEFNIFNEADIVFVEEGQFFPDLYEFAIECANLYDKNIIISGLDGDFQLNPFEQIIKLIPNSEKLTKLTALCKQCGDGTEACFSKRIIKDDKRELIGSDGIYEAVCRKHYYS